MQRSITTLAAAFTLAWGVGCDHPQNAPANAPPAPGASASASAAPASSGLPAQVRTQAPGYYRMMLGDFEITVLSDGTAPRPVDKILIPTKPGEVESLVGRNHESLNLELSINAFLVHTGSRLILIDTGAGEFFGPRSGGRLLQNLRAAGYSPEQIGEVLLTHVHTDHSGGLVAGGRRVFPNARVHLHKNDRDHWLSAAEAARAQGDRKHFFEEAHTALDPYIAADKVVTFDSATELFPGITTVPAPGHTPGHTYYMVESKGQKLLLWGDVVHVAEVQFPDPAVTIQYDNVAADAAAQRAKIFADAAKQGYLVGADHISFPGIGHIFAEGSTYVWSPVPYSLPQ